MAHKKEQHLVLFFGEVNLLPSNHRLLLFKIDVQCLIMNISFLTISAITLQYRLNTGEYDSNRKGLVNIVIGSRSKSGKDIVFGRFGR